MKTVIFALGKRYLVVLLFMFCLSMIVKAQEQPLKMEVSNEGFYFIYETDSSFNKDMYKDFADSTKRDSFSFSSSLNFYPDLSPYSLTLSSYSWSSGDLVKGTLIESSNGMVEALSHINTVDLLDAGNNIVKTLKSINFGKIAGWAYQEKSFSFSVPDVPSGTYRVGVLVDAVNSVVELFENNNSYLFYTVKITNGEPDLQAVALNGWDDAIIVSSTPGTNTDSEINTGDDVYIDFAVGNAGDADAVPFSVGVYVDNEFVNAYHSNSLMPGDVSFVNDHKISGLAEGTHIVSIKCDMYQMVNESNENNNIYEKRFVVKNIEKPIIQITPASLIIKENENPFSQLKSGYVADEPPYYPVGGMVIPDEIREKYRNVVPDIKHLKSYASYVDWSDNDSPVKNQGNCNACWAFSVTALIENLSGIDDLSEQTLISCSGAGSCSNGGYMAQALAYVGFYGIPDESCFPYKEADDNCGEKCSNPRVMVSVENYNTEALWGNNHSKRTIEDLKYLLQSGPVVVGMYAPEDFVYNYEGGIYDYQGGYIDQNTTGHAVLLVGYDDAKQCFKAKNSWGTSWGENGYFRIAYNDVTDDVKFGNYPVTASGAIIEGDKDTEPMVQDFLIVKNTGKSDLTIESILPQNDYINYDVEKYTLSPGEHTIVTLVVNWTEIEDEITTSLIVSSNASNMNLIEVDIHLVPDEKVSQINIPTAFKATEIADDNFIANWEDIAGADYYLLDVAHDELFNDKLDGYDEKLIFANYHNIDFLDPDTEYYYRVKAVKGSMVSEYSNTIHVKTLDMLETIIGDEVNFLDLIIYPNPTSGYIMVKTNADLTNIKVEITDITGRVLLNGRVDNNAELNNVLKSGTSTLSRGIYLLILKKGSVLVYRNFIKE